MKVLECVGLVSYEGKITTFEPKLCSEFDL